jgi:hypothetical protein
LNNRCPGAAARISTAERRGSADGSDIKMMTSIPYLTILIILHETLVPTILHIAMPPPSIL